MVLTLLVTAGCQEGQGTSSSSGSSGSITKVQEKQAPKAEKQEKKDEKPQEISTKVYYPNADGTKLIAVKRKFTVSADKDKYAEAVKSLMQGTKEKNQSVIIPKQAKLRGVKLEGGVARVDFSQDLVKHFVGGSTGEEMLVGSIVNTLTEFPEVKQVQILIEGSPVETIAGHMDLSTPLERMKDLL
ncbi:MAG: GerMN domain-containing protein [Selenomonas sp.]|nr:GerMN domain-containing protein [Selenomonas sp.]